VPNSIAVVNEGGAAGGWPNRCEVLGFLNDFVESRNEGGLRASVTQDREAHPPPGQLRSVPNDFFSGSLKRFQFHRFYLRPCFLEFKRLVSFCQSENDRQTIEDAMTNFLDTRIGETRAPKAHSSGDLVAGADHHRVAVAGNQ